MLLCCFCNCLLLIEAFVVEIDVLIFFEIGFRQLLPAPRSWVGSCVWGMALGGDETHDICFSTAPFSLNSLKKLVKCHLTSSFPTSNGTFVVAINCFSCIGTIEFCQFQFSTVYIRPRRCLHRLHRFCEENIAPIFNVCHLHHEIFL